MLRHRREVKKEIREHNDVHLERLGTSRCDINKQY